MYLLTVGIASNIGQFRIQGDDLMAGTVVATVPIILLYGILSVTWSKASPPAR